MVKKIKIAAVGDNCMDVYDNTGNVYPGGNPVNVAVYVVRLGGEASYTGVVGTDAYGQEMIQSIGNKGVDISHMRKTEGKTAISHVELIDGERIFGDYEEGVLADFKLTEDEISFLCSQDLVVTGIWGMIEQDLHKIKDSGVPVAFDFATKYEDPIVEQALPHVTYAFFAFDQEEETFLKQFMLKTWMKGPKIVIVTLGERGSMAYDGKYFYTYGIISCNVIDSMGAGDSYIAGFLYGILQGKEIEQCMKEGAQNSSVTLTYAGAW